MNLNKPMTTELAAEVEQNLLSEGRRKLTFYRVMYGITQILIPVIITVVVGFPDTLINENLILFWVFLGFLVFIQVTVGMFSIAKSDQSANAYVLYQKSLEYQRDLEQKFENITVDIQYFQTTDLAFYTWYRMQATYCKNGIESIKKLKEAISEITKVVERGRVEFFGLENLEKWNLSIYVRRCDQDKLFCIHRVTAHNFPKREHPREWNLGIGHVGLTFLRRTAIITGKAVDPDISVFFKDPNETNSQRDQELYKSFASFPIVVGESNNAPLGVVVMTSDRPERFDRHNTIVLRNMTTIIGSLIENAISRGVCLDAADLSH